MTVIDDKAWQTRIDAAIATVKGSTPEPVASTIPINKTIDHTVLKLDATEEQIDQLCEEARRYDFATVCVRPNYIARCVKNLKGTDVGVATVIGFHEGTYDTAHKLKETQQSIDAGATELDVVINWPALKDKRFTEIHTELKSIADVTPPSVHLKLIFETSQLDDDQIIAACVLASAAGFHYVKTSTGFLGHGAKVEHVQLMWACCQYLNSQGAPHMQVKASGGVRSLSDARSMITAGASRLGTSAGVAIAQQSRA